MSVCLGRIAAYHINLQLHRDNLFHHFVSNAYPERPLQGWGGWCTSRITPFPVSQLAKPTVPFIEEILELHGKNWTEAIQQRVAKKPL